jgi:hypothetical protein
VDRRRPRSPYPPETSLPSGLFLTRDGISADLTEGVGDGVDRAAKRTGETLSGRGPHPSARGVAPPGLLSTRRTSRCQSSRTFWTPRMTKPPVPSTERPNGKPSRLATLEYLDRDAALAPPGVAGSAGLPMPRPRRVSAAAAYLRRCADRSRKSLPIHGNTQICREASRPIRGNTQICRGASPPICHNPPLGPATQLIATFGRRPLGQAGGDATVLGDGSWQVPPGLGDDRGTAWGAGVGVRADARGIAARRAARLAVACFPRLPAPVD